MSGADGTFTGEPAAPPMEAFTTHPSQRRPAVVADANALVSDAIRRSRGLFSLMPYLAEQKLVSLLSPEHIDAKVFRRLPDACENAHADLDAATTAYMTIHRPLLRLVEVGDMMGHDRRVTEVGVRDDEDRPVAQLGVLLAPSVVLTRDVHLLDSGIGVRDWADALVVLKELVELDTMMWGAAGGTTLMAVLAFHGVAALARLVFRSEVTLGVTIGAAIVLGRLFRDELADASKRLKTTTGGLLERSADLAVDAFARRESVHHRVQSTLVLPHGTESLDSAVAHILMHASKPVAASDVHARLPVQWTAAEPGDVLAVLRAAPAFEFVRGRGWELGHGAVGQPAGRLI